MIVLGGILAWQYVNLFRLQRWLKHRAHEDPPDIGGVWYDVVAIINRIYRRKQFHKRRVTQQFRESPPVGRAAGRRRAAVGGTGDPLVQPMARALAAPQAGRRHPDREPGGDPNSWHTCRSREPVAGSSFVRNGDPSAIFVIPAGPQYLMLVRDAPETAAGDAQGFVANASHELRSRSR
jgi:hypothetical protein